MTNLDRIQRLTDYDFTAIIESVANDELLSRYLKQVIRGQCASQLRLAFVRVVSYYFINITSMTKEEALQKAVATYLNLK